MEIIDKHIKETEEIIKTNDAERAKKQYNFLFSVYSSKISDYEKGTSVFQFKENSVWNLNGLNLPTKVDYIADLKLVLDKIILYKQEKEQSNFKSTNSAFNNNVTIEDNSIQISNSHIQDSQIGQAKTEKKSVWKIVAGIIAGLAGITAVLTFILELCGVL